MYKTYKRRGSPLRTEYDAIPHHEKVVKYINELKCGEKILTASLVKMLKSSFPRVKSLLQTLANQGMVGSAIVGTGTKRYIKRIDLTENEVLEASTYRP